MTPKSILKKTKALYSGSEEKTTLFLNLKEVIKVDPELESYKAEYEHYKSNVIEQGFRINYDDFYAMFAAISSFIGRCSQMYACFRDTPRVAAVILHQQAKALEVFRKQRNFWCTRLGISKAGFDEHIPNHYHAYKQQHSKNADALFYHLRRSPRYSKFSNTSVGRVMYSIFSPRREYDIDFNIDTPLSLNDCLQLIARRLYPQSLVMPFLSVEGGLEDNNDSLPSYEDSLGAPVPSFVINGPIFFAPENQEDNRLAPPSYEESLQAPISIMEDDADSLPDYEEPQEMLAGQVL